jgi:hypothetical protein
MEKDFQQIIVLNNERLVNISKLKTYYQEKSVLVEKKKTNRREIKELLEKEWKVHEKYAKLNRDKKEYAKGKTRSSEREQYFEQTEIQLKKEIQTTAIKTQEKSNIHNTYEDMGVAIDFKKDTSIKKIEQLSEGINGILIKNNLQSSSKKYFSVLHEKFSLYVKQLDWEKKEILQMYKSLSDKKIYFEKMRKDGSNYKNEYIIPQERILEQKRNNLLLEEILLYERRELVWNFQELLDDLYVRMNLFSEQIGIYNNNVNKFRAFGNQKVDLSISIAKEELLYLNAFMKYYEKDTTMSQKLIDDILLYEKEKIIKKSEDLNLKIKWLNDRMVKYSSSFWKILDSNASRLNDSRVILKQQVNSTGDLEE